MKKLIKAGGLILVVLIVGLGYLKVASRRDAKVREESLAAFEAEQKGREVQFMKALDDLEKQNLISNASEYKAEFQRYKSEEGRTYIMALATSTFKRNPTVGLRIYEELCLVYYNNAEMGEWIAGEINELLYKELDQFVNGLAHLDVSKFQCLPRHVSLSWVEDSQKEGFDYQAENKKFAEKIRKYQVKDNPNVKTLADSLEGA